MRKTAVGNSQLRSGGDHCAVRWEQSHRVPAGGGGEGEGGVADIKSEKPSRDMTGGRRVCRPPIFFRMRKGAETSMERPICTQCICN